MKRFSIGKNDIAPTTYTRMNSLSLKHLRSSARLIYRHVMLIIAGRIENVKKNAAVIMFHHSKFRRYRVLQREETLPVAVPPWAKTAVPDA